MMLFDNKTYQKEMILVMKKEKRFNVETLEQSGSGLTTVIIDKETGVQYLLAAVPNIGSGMALLVDSDGKPLLEK